MKKYNKLKKIETFYYQSIIKNHLN